MSKLFIDACFNRKIERTPVWMMRQAGRYLADYRELKTKYDFLTLCKTPELAAKVTLMPLKEVNPDGAILFSDILIVLPVIGIDVSFNPGPIISNPVKTAADIENINVVNKTEKLVFVYEAIKNIKAELPEDVALIGFGGAPLTLAAYLTGGGKTGNFKELRALIYSDPQRAHLLLDKLVDLQADFLTSQIEAGAEAVQIFDTWAGSMPREVVKEFVIPKIAALIEKIRQNIASKGKEVPIIYFIKDGSHVLDLLNATGADVISIDEKISISYAAKFIRNNISIQGNLDSSVLYCSKDIITQKVDDILKSVPSGRGHIFNLGHGILPDTPVENARFMISEVKRLSKRV
ncbi:MAG: uroporphyrinogen decarboxylase [Deltaproteobacteria bacterium]|nr:uroporphyrinogen decarboxylase [Deltaproteobacteria bacterium]